MRPPFAHILGLSLLACILTAITATASAQTPDLDRARAQLDAARAMIDPARPLNAATQYAKLIPLEVKAQRPENARELTHLIVGLMQEDNAENRDKYIHLLARIDLDNNNTQAALRALEQVAEPDFFTKELYLAAVHQTAERFGLQRAVDLAREAFPEVRDRTNVYCKLCYTLANNEQADLAKEFIEVVMDLQEIYMKLDAYRFAAVGQHAAGDTEGGAGFLELALPQVLTYPDLKTRVRMLRELAFTFDEIGRNERARGVLALAVAAADEMDPGSHDQESAVEDLAQSWAVLGDYDRAMALTEQVISLFTRERIYKILIENDLAAGNINRAAALNEQHNVYFGEDFNVKRALAALDRGDPNAALATLSNLGSLVTEKWHQQAAHAFAQHAQHNALQTLLPQITNPHDRFNFILGSIEGYLAQ